MSVQILFPPFSSSMTRLQVQPQMNGSMGQWFRTVRVRTGCLLSLTLFSIYIQWIMSDALEEHDGKVSICSINIIDLQFANDKELRE